MLSHQTWFLFFDDDIYFFNRLKMDNTMKKFQEKLTEIETEAENFLLARHQVIEILSPSF